MAGLIFREICWLCQKATKNFGEFSKLSKTMKKRASESGIWLSDARDMLNSFICFG